MTDRDSSRRQYRLQIIAILMIGVLVWTLGGTQPDVRAPAGYHLTVGAMDAHTPMLRSYTAPPAVRAILVPVAVPATPVFEVVADIAIGLSRKARSRTAARSAHLSLSVTARAENPNRYSLRL